MYKLFRLFPKNNMLINKFTQIIIIKLNTYPKSTFNVELSRKFAPQDWRSICIFLAHTLTKNFSTPILCYLVPVESRIAIPLIPALFYS